MTLFQTLTKNGFNDFSNFWYGARGDDYLTFCENRMSKNSGSRDMAQNAFRQSDRSIFRNHILHTNPKKMLFFPKKIKIYFSYQS